MRLVLASVRACRAGDGADGALQVGRAAGAVKFYLRDEGFAVESALYRDRRKTSHAFLPQVSAACTQV